MIPRFARRRGAAQSRQADAVQDEPQGLARRNLVPQPTVEAGPATEMLFARLTPQDIAEVQQRLDDGHRPMWDYATPAQRKRLALAFALHYGVAGVPERTGLSPASPPSDVHSMVRGWISETGGSYYFADLVLESLDLAGGQLAPGVHALDFSCSSGRVVRPLAAARSDVRWHACDPNAGAIAWAREHVGAVDFFVSETAAPLPFDDGLLDLAFAISVWSHYSEAAALRWLKEMHRLVRPGGHLLVTTHGLQACVWFTRHRDALIDGKLGQTWTRDTAHRLQQNGHCFWDVFGTQGDWGVVDSDWGLAFFTPEWLLENITPAWALLVYRIGRAHDNQDIYLLRRN